MIWQQNYHINKRFLMSTVSKTGDGYQDLVFHPAQLVEIEDSN